MLPKPAKSRRLTQSNLKPNCRRRGKEKALNSREVGFSASWKLLAIRGIASSFLKP